MSSYISHSGYENFPRRAFAIKAGALNYILYGFVLSLLSHQLAVLIVLTIAGVIYLVVGRYVWIRELPEHTDFKYWGVFCLHAVATLFVCGSVLIATYKWDKQDEQSLKLAS